MIQPAIPECGSFEYLHPQLGYSPERAADVIQGYFIASASTTGTVCEVVTEKPPELVEKGELAIQQAGHYDTVAVRGLVSAVNRYARDSFPIKKLADDNPSSRTEELVLIPSDEPTDVEVDELIDVLAANGERFVASTGMGNLSPEDRAQHFKARYAELVTWLRGQEGDASVRDSHMRYEAAQILARILLAKRFGVLRDARYMAVAENPASRWSDAPAANKDDVRTLQGRRVKTHIALLKELKFALSEEIVHASVQSCTDTDVLYAAKLAGVGGAWQKYLQGDSLTIVEQTVLESSIGSVADIVKYKIKNALARLKKPSETKWSSAKCLAPDAPDLFVSGAEQNSAKTVCINCPIQQQCLAEALDNHIEFGVWGGMNERERRALLLRRPNVVSWARLLETARLEHARYAEVAAQA